jgi:hypothetical protein
MTEKAPTRMADPWTIGETSRCPLGFAFAWVEANAVGVVALEHRPNHSKNSCVLDISGVRRAALCAIRFNEW